MYMNVWIVLEIIRGLRLEKEHKIIVASSYGTITNKQDTNFAGAIAIYEGRVNDSFRDSLYDKYVYALNVQLDGTGLTIYDYLLAGRRFSERQASSFMITE